MQKIQENMANFPQLRSNWEISQKEIPRFETSQKYKKNSIVAGLWQSKSWSVWGHTAPQRGGGQTKTNRDYISIYE